MVALAEIVQAELDRRNSGQKACLTRRGGSCSVALQPLGPGSARRADAVTLPGERRERALAELLAAVGSRMVSIS